MKRLAVVLTALVLTACFSTEKSRASALHALESAGYTHIEMTGFKAFGCDEKDTFHEGFKAIGVNGAPVSGVVCSGWLKGSTIRTE